MVVSMLPIIILLLIIVILFFLQRYMQDRSLRKLFIFYTVILIASSMLVYLLPIDHFIAMEDYKVEHFNSEKYYNAAVSGTLSHYDNVVNKKEWSFPFSNDVLTIRTDNDGGVPIFVVRTDQLNTIKIIYYRTKNIVHSRDITDKVPSYEVNLEGSELYILKPEEFKYNIKGLKPNFITSQFKNNKADDWNDSIDEHLRTASVQSFDAVYLYVPKGVTISSQIGYKIVEE